MRSLAQAGNEHLSGRVLDRLVGRKLVQPEPLHNFRVPDAETLIVFPRPPCGTIGIDQTTLGDRPPVLHLFGCNSWQFRVREYGHDDSS
jgi:hypothetical protein